MFSRLAARFHGNTNPLYSLLGEIRAQGHEVIDLVSGNVTEHGIVFPQELLETILMRVCGSAAVYRPDSLGQLAAREAIAAYYAEAGLSVHPGRILLTPGTSISYWYCFKLLANEGDEILCPRPSYPLFDYIAALSGVNMIPYPLDEAAGWSMDPDRMESQISTRTRAIVLLSPHNPTGHVASDQELRNLAEIAARHRLALISDEVFSEFLLEAGRFPRAAATAAPLVMTLNGFSKMFALPGIKLGWMALAGDEAPVQSAMRALELISDTFLPVNELVQAVVPAILDEGRSFLGAYRQEIRLRWETARSLLSQATECRFVKPGGGFYVTVDIGDTDEERAGEKILAESHILVHPGHFYDIRPNHLVFSFAQEPSVIRKALPAILRVVDRCGEGPEETDLPRGFAP